LKPIKFNPNDPKLWKDYNPHERAVDYVDGKNQTSILISNNNRRTWSNEEIREKRTSKIREVKKEYALSLQEKKNCYIDSFGPQRNNGLYKELSKKYGINIHYVSHIASNFYKTVSDEEHEKNLATWNKQFGSFGIWRLHSPGQNLLSIYDKHYKNNKIPPSAIFHIRFFMQTASATEIRNYLLPWTNNEWLRFPTGKIRNGSYISYRKKQYPWLKQGNGQIFEFTDMESFYQFIKKYYGKSLTKEYARQVLRGSAVKEDGPMVGWFFEKIK